MLKRVVIITSFFIVFSSVAGAATVNWYFSAGIDGIDHYGGGYGDVSGYSVGGTASGIISFNDDATNSSNYSNRVELLSRNTPVPLEMDVTISSGISSFAFTNENLTRSTINIINNVGNISRLTWKDVLYLNAVNDYELFIVSLSSKEMPYSGGQRPTMLTDLEYDLSSLDLSPSEGPLSINSLFLRFTDPGDKGRYTSITGHLTYLANSPSSVPIPSAAWLFGTGLIGLMAIRKKLKWRDILF